MHSEMYICNRCNGKGRVPIPDDFDHNVNEHDFICPKCYGHKKLDWIENIVGKKIDQDIWFAPAGFNTNKRYYGKTLWKKIMKK